MRTVEVDIGNGQVATLTQPDRGDFPANLGGAVQYALANVLIWIAETSGDALGTFLGSGLVSFLERIEPHLVEIYSPIIRQLRSVDGIPPWFDDFLDSLENPEHEAGAAVAQAVLGSAAGGITGSLLGVLLSPLTYGANDAIRPARPGVADALAMRWREEIDLATFDDWLSDQGWPTLAIDAFKETVRPRPVVNDLLAMVWRDEDAMTAFTEELAKRGYTKQDAQRFIEIIRPRADMDTLLGFTYRQDVGTEAAAEELRKRGYEDADIDKYLEMWRPRPAVGNLFDWAWRVHQDPEQVRGELVKRGYLDDDIDKMMEIATFIPNIGDLITMAVREAFSPAAIAEYGLGDRYPEELTEWAEKKGVTADWAKRYWYAHWVLPSMTMGFEMLHRGEIDKEGLRDLLTYADVAPGWIDKLINIGYTPYTRVDIRRMYDVGVLSEADLVKAHKDIGYDDEKAAKMAQFVIGLYTEADLGYTKAEVRSAYKTGMYTRAEAVSLLVALGETSEYANWVLSLEDFKRAQSLMAENLKYVKTLYVNGELDRSSASSQLSALDLEGSRISRLLEEWDIAKQAKIARPTVANIMEWYKENVFGEATARDELAKRRYPDYVINWMIRDWDTEAAADAQKEAERAQKEQERITKAEFKTNRAVALANLNAQIAEVKLFVAETKVAIYYAEGAEQYETIRTQIADLWTEYWRAPDDAARATIKARMDALYEQVGLLDAVIVRLEENIMLAKQDIARLQLEKARLPVTPEGKVVRT